MTSSRPWMIALAASAVINVFLIGGLAGLAYARLTAPPAAPVAAVPTRPAVVPASPAPPPQPAVTVETPPSPAAHPAPVRERPAPAPVAPAPPVVEAPPPGDPAGPTAAQLRPPLISAGDMLSPESRRAFRMALNEANKKNRPLTQQARAERQAALAALGSPGYDATEVAKRLSAARALDLQARGNVEAALAAYAATLTPSERTILADGLARVYAPIAARRAAMAGPN
ncbi:periplasmic heavy metal sensor [Caulobacter sp. 1776]|uniref:periplasmic heavy metal sensor n=1 Tax=Caulobacter sp. 1776 TaxID=3156420 RepID=UPI003391029D